jgi:acetyl-CoA carboxylase biotin carboxyl carrier protein
MPPQTRKAGSTAKAGPGDKAGGSGISDATSAAEVGPTVELVRGLAALVSEHGLSELVVDLPNATITLRRGFTDGHALTAPPPQHVATMHGSSMPSMASMTLAHAGAPSPAHHVAAAPAAAASAPAAPAPVAEPGHMVTSPFVGTFYRRPNPDSPNYASIGERVDKGQTLCIIEAMKLMNEIEADVAGVVADILAEDGSPVEYGQKLFRILPS